MDDWAIKLENPTGFLEAVFANEADVDDDGGGDGEAGGADGFAVKPAFRFGYIEIRLSSNECYFSLSSRLIHGRYSCAFTLVDFLCFLLLTTRYAARLIQCRAEQTNERANEEEEKKRKINGENDVTIIVG